MGSDLENALSTVLTFQENHVDPQGWPRNISFEDAFLHILIILESICRIAKPDRGFADPLIEKFIEKTGCLAYSSDEIGSIVVRLSVWASDRTRYHLLEACLRRRSMENISNMFLLTNAPLQESDVQSLVEKVNTESDAETTILLNLIGEKQPSKLQKARERLAERAKESASGDDIPF